MTSATSSAAAPATPAVRSVAFSIAGETITDFARGLVLEGDWDRALNILLSEIEGMTYEIAIGIISGRMKLVGTSASPDGITLEDDDDQDHIEQLAEMTTSLARFQGSWWRARSAVVRLGRPDKIAAEIGSIRPVKTVEYDDSFVGGPCDLRYENACARALFYVGDGELVTLAKIHDNKGRERCLPVIFTPAGKPPIWLQGNLRNDLATAARNASDAFALDFVGAAEDEMVPAEAAKHRMAEAAASRPPIEGGTSRFVRQTTFSRTNHERRSRHGP